jgi:hypothetical protein
VRVRASPPVPPVSRRPVQPRPDPALARSFRSVFRREGARSPAATTCASFVLWSAGAFRPARSRSSFSLPKTLACQPELTNPPGGPGLSSVCAAGTQLDTLVQLDPIYVTFNPSESDLALLGDDGGAGRSRRRRRFRMKAASDIRER